MTTARGIATPLAHILHSRAAAAAARPMQRQCTAGTTSSPPPDPHRCRLLVEGGRGVSAGSPTTLTLSSTAVTAAAASAAATPVRRISTTAAENATTTRGGVNASAVAVTGFRTALNPGVKDATTRGGRIASVREESGAHIVDRQPSPHPPAGDIVVRILCYGGRTRRVIGEAGAVIKQLQEDTLSRIKLENVVPGSNERVIVISAPDTPGEESSPALDAALGVYALMMRPEDKHLRLLVPSSQTGCLLGKGGIIINEMREQSGAQIRVCAKEHLPSCALRGDDMVQITGESSAVLRAFQLVLAKLRATPPSEALSGQAIGNFRSLTGSTGAQVMFRVLCPGNRTGSVIGRSGDTIEALREQCGAKIMMLDAIPGCEERVVAISCVEDGVSPVSPAQVALLRVYACIAEPPQTAGAAAYTAPPPFRLLIPGQQVGYLIGKGGATIKAMCEGSGAHIRVLPHEQLPGCALEGDKLLEIGASSPYACAAAVQAVSTRLRAYVPRPVAPAGPEVFGD